MTACTQVVRHRNSQCALFFTYIAMAVATGCSSKGGNFYTYVPHHGSSLPPRALENTVRAIDIEHQKAIDCDFKSEITDIHVDDDGTVLVITENQIHTLATTCGKPGLVLRSSIQISSPTGRAAWRVVNDDKGAVALVNRVSLGTDHVRLRSLDGAVIADVRPKNVLKWSNGQIRFIAHIVEKEKTCIIAMPHYDGSACVIALDGRVVGAIACAQTNTEDAFASVDQGGQPVQFGFGSRNAFVLYNGHAEELGRAVLPGAHFVNVVMYAGQGRVAGVDPRHHVYLVEASSARRLSIQKYFMLTADERGLDRVEELTDYDEIGRMRAAAGIEMRDRNGRTIYALVRCYANQPGIVGPTGRRLHIICVEPEDAMRRGEWVAPVNPSDTILADWAPLAKIPNPAGGDSLLVGVGKSLFMLTPTRQVGEPSPPAPASETKHP